MKNEYTDTEVLSYWKNTIGTQKTRKRDYVDPRNYILALLHFKFGYIEAELGEIFEVHRTSINHAKKHPYDHMDSNDPQFIENTSELIKLFPYIFPKAGDIKPTKLYPVVVKLNKRQLTSLKNYSVARSRRTNQAAADIINTYLQKKIPRKWEE